MPPSAKPSSASARASARKIASSSISSTKTQSSPAENENHRGQPTSASTNLDPTHCQQPIAGLFSVDRHPANYMIEISHLNFSTF
jgi:hypothetical protein